MKPVITSLVQQVQELASGNRSDRELIQDYIHLRDEASFRLLVERHAPLVWEASRRILGTGPDSEDVFQATFLAFAQKADRIQYPERLTGWLFGTALRIAHKVHRSRIRRMRHEQQVESKEASSPSDQLAADELLRILHEEVNRLPDEYRLPLLLCYWERLTQEEIALRLGWSSGSVKGRLERGRKRLGERLRKRGVPLSVLLTLFPISSPIHLIAQTIVLGIHPWSPSIRSSISKLAVSVRPMRWISTLGIGLLVVGMGSLALGVGQSEAKKSTTDSLNVEQKKETSLDPFGESLPEKAIRRFGSNRFHHGSPIQCLALSPDGSQIVTGGSGTIRWFDASTGQVQGEIAISTDLVHSIQVRSDGKRLLAVGWMRGNPQKEVPPKTVIFVWDWPTKKILWKRPYEGQTCHCDFSPDGKKVLIQSNFGTREMVDAETGKTLTKFTGHGIELAFSPNGKIIAYCNEKKVEIRNAESDRMEQAFEHQSHPQKIAFSPDGKYLATTVFRNEQLNSDGTICLWDMANGKMVKTLSTGNGSSRVIAFSSDGKWLVAGYSQETKVREEIQFQTVTKIWEVATGKEQFTFTLGEEHELSGLQFSPNNRKLYGSVESGSVLVWDLETGKSLFDSKKFSGAGQSVAESPDRSTLVTGSVDGMLRFWDLSTGQLQGTIHAPTLTGPSKKVWHMDFNADGSRVITSDFQGNLRWFDRKEGKEVYHHHVDGKAFTRTAFPPNRKSIAFVGEEKILLLDTTTGKEIRRFARPEDPVQGVAFSFDGNYLAIVCLEEKTRLKVLSVQSGKQLFEANVSSSDWDEFGTETIRFTPDGYGISYIVGEKRKIFDFVTQKERTPPSGIPIQRAEYSPVGAWLATMESDGMIRIRDSETEKEILSFRSPSPRIAQFVWSADRRSLYSGQSDDTVIQWDLSPSKEEPKEISTSEADTLWKDLASQDPKKAYQAYWRVLTAKKGLSFLQDRLKSATEGDDKQVPQWIEDLNSDQFSVREKASQGLQKLGGRSLPALEQLRRTTDSADIVQRLDKILANLETPKPDYRFLRCLEILEAINTPEAIALLQTLSKGNPHTDRTQRARGALKRLGQ